MLLQNTMKLIHFIHECIKSKEVSTHLITFKDQLTNVFLPKKKLMITSFKQLCDKLMCLNHTIN